ncbi:hypothetical protein Ddye_010899 [Dipteronia dyeriana]|uniref:Uncharacterized protein n=1 Tax=Dipteronia dyeriana TaxID=168575 RepID=A0AAD9XEK3_9ROSI|nr:hypothetical protein Ddye_010899 [Dipteronia dyeriana]
MEKRVIFHRLMVKFEVDLLLKHIQRLVNFHCASSYGGLRNKIYMHYPSLEQAKAHPHKYASKDDCVWFCDNIFSTENFQTEMKILEDQKNVWRWRASQQQGDM